MEILVGYEASEVAKDALALAAEHAKTFNAKIYVVTSMVGGKNVPQEDFTRAEENLEKAGRRLAVDNLDFETRLLVRGMEPGEDLVRFAEEKGVDEVVIGIKRRSKVGKLLFGSNAQYVILNAPCPVVTIR